MVRQNGVVNSCANIKEIHLNVQSPDLKKPHRFLSLFDCVCIIVGTIIGAGIFETPANVAANLGGVLWFVAIWVFGGAVALIGALCFAELTTCYSEAGGDYVYLKRGYGKRVGFAFSWSSFWITRPGNIGTMAIIFGKFASTLFPLSQEYGVLIYAALSVCVLSLTHVIGVRYGMFVQNLLTVAKVGGILIVVLVACLFPTDQGDDLTGLGRTESSEVAKPAEAALESGSPSSESLIQEESRPPATTWSSFWLAMVFVMFTYGGWNDIAFVAAEVQEPRRNLVRSLVFGTSGVIVVYLLINVALVYSLGYEGVARSEKPAHDLVLLKAGAVGAQLFSVLVCVSCLGAINAMVFTSPRIYSATARDYPRLKWLTGRTSQDACPDPTGDRIGFLRSLMLQTGVTLCLILVCGIYKDSFEVIVAVTAPYFWTFLALAVGSLMLGRVKFGCSTVDGYRVPLYPLLPVIFIAACLFMTFQCGVYVTMMKWWWPAVLVGVLMAVGVVASFFLETGEG